MMDHGPDSTPPQPVSPGAAPPRMLEIGGVGSGRRWARWVGFILLYGLIAALLGWVFGRFGATLALSVGLVGFMIAYMVLVGAATGRNLKE
jgi:hypothetical protein